MGNAVYPRYKAWKANGTSPAVGYYLYTYVAGSVVPKPTYADADFASANANPIVLDSNGEATIFLTEGDYRFDLKTPAGALINTFDPVNSSSGSGSTGALLTIDNIALLRLLDPPTLAVTYEVLGYYAVGDFGGGRFYFNTLSSATDDGGSVIRPSTNPTLGRWIRINDRPLSVRGWGWLGTGAPIDATAIANMQTYVNAIVFPGYFNIPGALAVGSILTLSASSTVRATLNIPSGTAPTSPVSGDMWYDGTNLKFRDGGTTRTITWV